MTRTVRLLYFAGLREALGCGEESVELPAEVATASDLRGWLRERGGAWEQQLAPGRNVRIEVALFPPVTGG